MPKSHNKLYNWLFRCHDGSYIYVQAPNIPLIIAAVAYILTIIIQDPVFKDIFVLIFRLSMLVWATLELMRGVNNFRRILGAGVLIVVSAGILVG